MARSNIEIFWNKVETAPAGVIAQVRVTDGAGPDYLLPYPCTLTSWVKADSGKPLAVRPTYWKVYVETLPRKKTRERTPRLHSAPTGAPLTIVESLSDLTLDPSR